jgi:hypothetical protein
LPAVLVQQFREVLTPGLVPFGIAGKIRWSGAHLLSDETEHRRRENFGGHPDTSGMTEEAELYGDADPVTVASVASVTGD